jgi:hypothetical protein
MQIIDLAYQGKAKEGKIIDLNENNDLIIFNISRLKSANYLGGNLLAEDSDLKFRGSDSIIQLVTPKKVIKKEEAVTLGNEKINTLLNFLSLRSGSEARADEKKDMKKPWIRSKF